MGPTEGDARYKSRPPTLLGIGIERQIIEIQVQMMYTNNFSALAAVLSTIWLVATAGSSVLPHAKILATRQTGYKWVDTWTSMPQLVEPANLPESPFVCINLRGKEKEKI